MKRKRCYICKKLTHDWERRGGAGCPYNCWSCGKIIREMHEKQINKDKKCQKN